jgi:hypothetical protein
MGTSRRAHLVAYRREILVTALNKTPAGGIETIPMERD